MIDIHTHLLPGLDDGAKTLEEAVEIGKVAAEKGVKGIVATPHLFRGNQNYEDIKLIEEKKVEVKELLSREKIDLEIYSGVEVHLSHRLLGELKNNKDILVMNRGNYMLVEFPSDHVFSGAKNLFFDLMSEGIKPIIAHPERNSIFRYDPFLLYELIQMGALSQVNSGSFVGLYGELVEQTVFRFLELELVHFIASDCHSVRSMETLNSDNLDMLRERFGATKIDALVMQNPQAVIDDKQVPFNPEAKNPKENVRSLKIKLPRFLRNGR
jgi:protein-tyrosine phosphatase